MCFKAPAEIELPFNVYLGWRENMVGSICVVFIVVPGIGWENPAPDSHIDGVYTGSPFNLQCQLANHQIFPPPRSRRGGGGGTGRSDMASNGKTSIDEERMPSFFFVRFIVEERMHSFFFVLFIVEERMHSFFFVRSLAEERILNFFFIRSIVEERIHSIFFFRFIVDERKYSLFFYCSIV